MGVDHSTGKSLCVRCDLRDTHSHVLVSLSEASSALTIRETTRNTRIRLVKLRVISRSLFALALGLAALVMILA